MPRTDRRPGHPTTKRVQRAILALQAALEARYGVDYSFTVCGAGYILGRSNIDGQVDPVTTNE